MPSYNANSWGRNQKNDLRLVPLGLRPSSVPQPQEIKRGITVKTAGRMGTTS
jgi:hypothetical protein